MPFYIWLSSWTDTEWELSVCAATVPFNRLSFRLLRKQGVSVWDRWLQQAQCWYLHRGQVCMWKILWTRHHCRRSCPSKVSLAIQNGYLWLVTHCCINCKSCNIGQQVVQANSPYVACLCLYCYLALFYDGRIMVWLLIQFSGFPSSGQANTCPYCAACGCCSTFSPPEPTENPFPALKPRQLQSEWPCSGPCPNIVTP